MSHPELTPQISSKIPTVLAVTAFASCLVQLDLTIVNVALQPLQAALRADVRALQWVVDAYTLGFAVLLLSAGAIGDSFGSRRVFLAGFVTLGVASLVCALSEHVNLLSLARGLQGIGAALMLPSSLALLRRACANDAAQLARALGIWSAVGGASLAIGPMLGGALIAMAGWRSIFYVNLPICALGIWLAWRQIPEDRTQTILRDFDWPGQIVGIVVLLMLVAGIIESAHLGPTHPLIMLCAVGVLVGGAIFVAIERRSRNPLLPLQMFRPAEFSVPVAFGLLINFCYCGLIFILSLYLQQALGLPPLSAGIAFIPLTATFIFANLISGRLTAQRGPGVPMVFGALIATVGYGALSLVVERGSVLFLVPAFILIPAGMGTAIPGMMACVLSATDARLGGTAMAVLNTARQVGAALGVAVFGALLATDLDRTQTIEATRVASMISCAILGSCFVLLAWTFSSRRRRLAND